VLIAHRETDSAQAQSCNMMKTKIQEGRLECGKFWEDWCLTATIRYAMSTQDGIGLTAWPIFNVFVAIVIRLLLSGLIWSCSAFNSACWICVCMHFSF
jgi:hypothetical protein